MKMYYIDLFCGAGGTSTGVSNARYNDTDCAEVIACVNHDPHAIASHASNHPNALHFTEDIRTLELSPLVDMVRQCRNKNKDAVIVLWASLECTNFSRAKGGRPRDADSRILAEHLFRYIDAINPDYLQIENVEEFMSWGEIDENGRPISMDKGRKYTKWCNNVKRRGYNYSYRLLNAADYGAYTSRKRFFGIFAKKGLPIAFPHPTHSRNGGKDLFDNLHKWKPVREVLDFSDDGTSIFRDKPLAERTLERIYTGLVKFIAGGKNAFIIKYNSMTKNNKYVAPGIDEPCPTITTQNRLGIAKVHFLVKNFSGHPDSKSQSIDVPAGTITTIDHHGFLSAYYGNGHNHSLNTPSPTLTTVDRLAFVNMEYGNGTPASVDEPAKTVTTTPKHNLVSAWILNPQFTSAGGSIDSPCFTLIARMDKMPPYLMVTKNGETAIAVYDTDSPMTRKIKEFMAMYNIVDIKMRMLKVSELKKIMGFPEDYILVGTQAEQKKYIGNAVEVNMAKVLCEEIYKALQMRVA